MMDKQLIVEVVYKDRDLKEVAREQFMLEEYMKLLANNAQKIVSDVEDVCYVAERGNPKSQWSEQVAERFNRIKHKLLDLSGDLERLPYQLTEQDLKDAIPLMFSKLL